jgi:16S rRNA processing protein RimM
VKLTVGIIERPHGVRGEFQASLTTDTPDRLLTLKSIFVGDEAVPRAIQEVRKHQDRLVFKLAGINNPEQVRRLSKTPLKIPGTAAAPLAEGEYFVYQLINSLVVDETGAELGRLVDIMETGANEVYVIRPEGSTEELLLPNIPSVILDIDVEQARIVVRPPLYY